MPRLPEVAMRALLALLVGCTPAIAAQEPLSNRQMGLAPEITVIRTEWWGDTCIRRGGEPECTAVPFSYWRVACWCEMPR
jgi:hypothetical protein